MKISISLSEKIGDALLDLREQHGSNPSAVVESALRLFLNLTPAERERAVRETHASKRPGTAQGWRAIFWRVLAEEFGIVEREGRNPMAARTYDGFSVIFLMRDVQNSDPEVLIVHVFADQARGESRPGITTEYRLDDSVYEAARATAQWIREHAGTATVK